jgi:hypothetical protein
MPPQQGQRGPRVVGYLLYYTGVDAHSPGHLPNIAALASRNPDSSYATPASALALTPQARNRRGMPRPPPRTPRPPASPPSPSIPARSRLATPSRALALTPQASNQRGTTAAAAAEASFAAVAAAAARLNDPPALAPPMAGGGFPGEPQQPQPQQPSHGAGGGLAPPGAGGGRAPPLGAHHARRVSQGSVEDDEERTTRSRDRQAVSGPDSLVGGSRGGRVSGSNIGMHL